MQVEICQNLQSDKSELQDVWGFKIKQSRVPILLFRTMVTHLDDLWFLYLGFCDHPCNKEI